MKRNYTSKTEKGIFENVRNRFAVSIILNSVRAIIIFVTNMILARGLGPQEYGVYSFLLATFVATIALLDMGSSSAFFSFISKKTRSKNFIVRYMIWVMFQFIAAFTFLTLILPEAWLDTIWHGESRKLVVLAFVAIFFQQQVWTFVIKVGESQRLTTSAQMLGVAIALIHSVFVIILFAKGLLRIEYVYVLITAEILIGCFVAKLIYPLKFVDEKQTHKETIVEYWIFCKPLIVYGCFSTIIGLTDTWLLQNFGGGLEQAYYAVAAQLGAVSLIFTSSIIRILWKEVAEANEKNRKEDVAVLYKRVSRILFGLSVLISGFLIPWINDIIILILGRQYLAGTTAICIMLLYPIHQTLGQINGSMYFALELTRPYVVINSAHLFTSIFAVYFFLAPSDATVPGLGLGSVGLSLKMLILQIVTVTISTWWLCRLQGWPFEYGYQFISIALIIVLSFICYQIVNLLFDNSVHVLIRGGICGSLYFMSAISLLYKVPWVIGLTKCDLRSIIHRK